MVTINVPVKPYLAKYMYVHYADSVVDGAIRLPGSGILYNALHQLTTKRPKGASWKEEGNLMLMLPNPAIGKSPEVFNYLSRENGQILEKKLNGK